MAANFTTVFTDYHYYVVLFFVFGLVPRAFHVFGLVPRAFHMVWFRVRFIWGGVPYKVCVWMGSEEREEGERSLLETWGSRGGPTPILGGS